MQKGPSPVRNLAKLALTEPLTVVDRVRTVSELRRLRNEPRSPSNHPVSARWDPALHDLLGTPTPCGGSKEFGDVWSTIKTSLSDADAISETLDGDANFGQAVWCAVLHLRPRRVIETGVARGVTSWIILEALARNATGHLWSIDLPKLAWTFEAGQAVPAALRSRWTYLRGASTRLLPPLVAQLGEIDLFIHDSLHTEGNVRFEMETAWPALSEQGLVLVDDIDDIEAYGSGRAFSAFVRDRDRSTWLVAPQSQKQGCFGAVSKRLPEP